MPLNEICERQITCAPIAGLLSDDSTACCADSIRLTCAVTEAVAEETAELLNPPEAEKDWDQTRAAGASESSTATVTVPVAPASDLSLSAPARPAPAGR